MKIVNEKMRTSAIFKFFLQEIVNSSIIKDDTLYILVSHKI